MVEDRTETSPDEEDAEGDAGLDNDPGEDQDELDAGKMVMIYRIHEDKGLYAQLEDEKGQPGHEERL